MLKEAEAGVKVGELCRKHGMSSPAFHAWRAKFCGMEVNDAKRLRSLGEENRHLEHVVADLALDLRLSQAVVAKNGEPCVTSRVRDLTQGENPKVSPRRASRVACITRIHQMLVRQGMRVGVKRVNRAYRQKT